MHRCLPTLFVLYLACTFAHAEETSVLERLKETCSSSDIDRKIRRKSCDQLIEMPGLRQSDVAHAYLIRADINNTDSNLISAFNDYRKAIELYPITPSLGTSYVEKFGKLNKAAAFTKRAIALFQLDNPERALSDLQQAIALDPDYGLPYFHYALHFEENGNYLDALKNYDRSIKLGINYTSAHYGRWKTFMKSRNNMPIPVLSGLFWPIPKDLPRESFTGRALAYGIVGKYEWAHQELALAFIQFPDAPELLNLQAWMLVTASDGRFRDGEKALTIIKKALKIGPRDPSVIDTLAAVYAELGDFDLATKYQKEAVSAFRDFGIPEGVVGAEYRLHLFENGQPFHFTPEP